MRLDEIPARAARESPDAPALISGAQRLSFSALEQRVACAAGALARRTRPGDRVALLAENRPEVVELYYAAPRAGRVLVLLNYRLSGPELARTVADSGASLLIGEPDLLARLAPHAALCRGAGEPVGLDDWSVEVGRSAPVGPVPADEDDPVWLIYTSGTTGQPKGAILTHRNLVTGLLASSLGRPVFPADVYLYPFPLCHVSGHNVCVFHLHRRPVVLLRRFDVDALLETVERERVTAMSLAPTMLSSLLDAPGLASADLSSLRSIGYGASAIAEPVLRGAMERLGCELSQGYGMTEMAGTAAFLDAAAHRRGLEREPQLLRAAGRTGPLIELRIVDDHDRDVASGTAGEIVARGDQLSPGYWNAPEASAEAWRGGWFHTGDIGRRDADGWLYVVDRKKDIIVSGGENVASREVEDALSLHPDVREVAVVGVPDPHWGEAVCAVVALRDGARPDADALVALSREQLAGYKKPRHVLFVDALPRNAGGKVLKPLLRERAAAELASGRS